ncbi:MAG: hypothetical protein NVS2B12_40470 [Ktedonobacteraceae bacterium]
MLNINEVLDNSHVAVIQASENLPEGMWDLPVTDNGWSAKDILAHLTARELVLIDVLKTFQGEQPSPYILRCVADPARFDAETVQSRKYQTAQQVVNEYQDAQLHSSSLLLVLPADAIIRQGSMPWLQTSETLADFIQTHANHAYEHATRLMQFREKNKTLES